MNVLQEMQAELKEARELYGDVLTVLNDPIIVPVKDMEEYGYMSSYFEDVTHVYAYQGTWSGYLTGFLIEWYTDYDFASGVFEYPDDPEEMEKLRALDDLMKRFDDTEWDTEKAQEFLNKSK